MSSIHDGAFSVNECLAMPMRRHNIRPAGSSHRRVVFTMTLTGVIALLAVTAGCSGQTSTPSSTAQQPSSTSISVDNNKTQVQLTLPPGWQQHQTGETTVDYTNSRGDDLALSIRSSGLTGSDADDPHRRLTLGVIDPIASKLTQACGLAVNTPQVVGALAAEYDLFEDPCGTPDRGPFGSLSNKKVPVAPDNQVNRGELLAATTSKDQVIILMFRGHRTGYPQADIASIISSLKVAELPARPSTPQPGNPPSGLQVAIGHSFSPPTGSPCSALGRNDIESSTSAKVASITQLKGNTGDDICEYQLLDGSYADLRFPAKPLDAVAGQYAATDDAVGKGVVGQLGGNTTLRWRPNAGAMSTAWALNAQHTALLNVEMRTDTLSTTIIQRSDALLGAIQQHLDAHTSATQVSSPIGPQAGKVLDTVTYGDSPRAPKKTDNPCGYLDAALAQQLGGATGPAEAKTFLNAKPIQLWCTVPAKSGELKIQIFPQTDWVTVMQETDPVLGTIVPDGGTTEVIAGHTTYWIVYKGAPGIEAWVAAGTTSYINVSIEDQQGPDHARALLDQIVPSVLSRMPAE